MSEEFIFLKFPTYKNFNYPLSNKRYSNPNNSGKDFFEKMKDIYEGFCPYCGEKLTDRAAFPEKEHTIERKQHYETIGTQKKAIEAEYIKHCKFNLCIACSTCNKLKANYLKKEYPKVIDKKYFSTDILSNICLNKKCSLVCPTMNEALEEYLILQKFIIQPHGVKNRFTNSMYEISYDVNDMEFIPRDKDKKYTEEDLRFINAHIKKLELNENRPLGINFEFINDIAIDVISNKIPIDKNYILRKKYNFSSILQKLFLEHLSTMSPIKQAITLEKLKLKYKKYK